MAAAELQVHVLPIPTGEPADQWQVHHMPTTYTDFQSLKIAAVSLPPSKSHINFPVFNSVSEHYRKGREFREPRSTSVEY